MEGAHNPFNGDVPDEALQNWLKQFNPSEQESIKPLLTHFRYYSSNLVFELLKTLHNKLVQNYRISPEHTWFVPFGYVAKSGSAIAYFYRRHNNLPQNRFIAAEDLGSIPLKDISAVVFLDDFIGSGHDAVRLWNKVVAPLKARAANCQFIFACIVGYESGIKYASSRTPLSIVVAEIIPRSEQPFEEDSVIYPSTEERVRAREIVQKYGSRLASKEPLGYGGTQGLVGFFFSTPNNTLPIFWSTQGNWLPLLPHGESLRDPNLLIGPPPGLSEETVLRDPRRSVIELEQLQVYDITPEIAVRIFGEFQSTSIFLVLAPIIHNLDMSNEVFGHLMNLLRKLEYAMHEKEPICSAIMFPSSKANCALFDQPFVAARESLTIADEAEVEALAHLVDGFDGTVVIHPDGRVIGNILYPAPLAPPDVFLPKRYWAATAASQSSNGLLILFAGEGRITLFYRGIRVLSHRNATWHIHSQAFDRALTKIESEHGLSHLIVSNVLKIAFEMSDLGYGALFTIGDEEPVLALSDVPKSDYVRWRTSNVQDLDKRPIITLAKQDGATIISTNGQVLRGMVFLRPPAGTKAEEEIGKGSKHDTAAKMSAATKAVTVAVSVDGRISLYSRGKLVFKMMG